jgi:hypothetical protein
MCRMGMMCLTVECFADHVRRLPPGTGDYAHRNFGCPGL